MEIGELIDIPWSAGNKSRNISRMFLSAKCNQEISCVKNVLTHNEIPYEFRCHVHGGKYNLFQIKTIKIFKQPKIIL